MIEPGSCANAEADNSKTIQQERRVMAQMYPNAAPTYCRDATSCRKLTSPDGFPVLAGRHAGGEFEGAAKVALIAESGVAGDIRQRLVRRPQLLDRAVDSQTANIFADRASLKPSEDSREMDSVHACDSSDAVESQVATRVFAQQFFDLPKPCRSFTSTSRRNVTSRPAEDLENQSFHHER